MNNNENTKINSHKSINNNDNDNNITFLILVNVFSDHERI